MKSKLGKKAEQLPRNALNVVLPADDDESCDLLRIITRLWVVT